MTFLITERQATWGVVIGIVVLTFILYWITIALLRRSNRRDTYPITHSPKMTAEQEGFITHYSNGSKVSETLSIDPEKLKIKLELPENFPKNYTVGADPDNLDGTISVGTIEVTKKPVIEVDNTEDIDIIEPVKIEEKKELDDDEQEFFNSWSKA